MPSPPPAARSWSTCGRCRSCATGACGRRTGCTCHRPGTGGWRWPCWRRSACPSRRPGGTRCRRSPSCGVPPGCCARCAGRAPTSPPGWSGGCAAGRPATTSRPSGPRSPRCRCDDREIGRGGPIGPCSRELDSTYMTTQLRPGRISPQRKVPPHIKRPEYVGKERPKTGEPNVKTPEVIERMRVAGKIAAQALEEVGRHVRPGITTDELDAYPSTLGYRGYPKSLCTSLNEVICHGIPDDTALRDGDIVNVDITAFIDGVHGDTDATFLVGDVDEESRLLVERTREAMMRGIRAVRPGRAINVIGRVIESYARRFGYGVVRDFTGHGIGTTFHSGLVVPHYDEPAHTMPIEAGMTFTIEPMLNLGTHE